MDKLSVIIPTLNEADYLPILLRALEHQTRRPDEVIVADAGSTDGTPDLARRSGARVVPGGRPGPGRNAGARAATGSVLLFLDADVEPAPDFIERALREFRGGVASCLIDSQEPSPLERLILEASNLSMWLVRPFSPHAPGFCLLVSRDLHVQIGGFDETLLLSEDHDYVRRAAQQAGFQILRGLRIPVSLRRIEKEGLQTLLAKYLWCEAQLLLGRPIRSLPFEYEFGAFHSRNSGRRLARAIRRLRARVNLSLHERAAL